jgi:ParB family chromosome partitioning protein
MDRLAERVVAEGISVRALEEMILVGEGDGRPRQRKTRPRGKDSSMEAAAADLVIRLADVLETRVRIEATKTHARGRILIDFADLTDLQRIVDQID